MVGKTKPPTAAQRRRMTRIKQLGCILCRELGLGIMPCEIHHITDCGRRLGHDHTVGICCWHHRGEPWTLDMRPSQMTATVGPSLAKNKRAFVSEFGTELDILKRQNDLIGRYQQCA